ncbi:TBC1 domain family member 15 isoform X2 [Lepisosteus oculatus]|uniref:TBC1 domain family member 15 isoform X2 n=1 Tax=Lepisosteus oculatus TaxID=7918 RepID=UPI00371AA64F
MTERAPDGGPASRGGAVPGQGREAAVGGYSSRTSWQGRDARSPPSPAPVSDGAQAEPPRAGAQSGDQRRSSVPGGASGSSGGPALPGLPGVMDSEGRVDESRLRTHIFKNGGVAPAERARVWRFLFGMFPSSSTALERPLLAEQLAVRYGAMKRKWRQLLPSAARIRLNGTDDELIAAVRFYERRREQAEGSQPQQGEEAAQRISFLELQAQVLMDRVSLDLEDLQEAVRIIDKDVPRTERDLDYFLGEGSANLLVLRDILITFAAFHPDVSYAQGMNDLCSRFLEVLDSEVDAYWCFSSYMERVSRDFREDGLRRKIELEADLLKELDPQLHSHLLSDTMDTLTFCHRWLLLGFQREFDHSDALRLFEILSCDHLELISQAVERARYQERLSLTHSQDEDPDAAPPPTLNTAFTFELFICAAILLEHRDALLRCRSEVELIQFTSSLQGKLDLNTVLQKAEEHFFNYFKRASWQGLGRRFLSRKSKEPLLLQFRSLFS